MKLNTPLMPIRTHEGAVAKRINTEQQLRRSVMSCLLWESEFYESGEDISRRIIALIPDVKPDAVASMAIEAREKMKLRHVPLLLVREMARSVKHRRLVGQTLARIIQRPDELSEFLAIYWKEGRCPLSKQVKIGLAGAFRKFDEYQLAKYNRDGAVKLRDVLFLSHAKPNNPEQEAVWKRLIDGTLSTPDTWEVSLSAGENKRAAWTRLLEGRKLGAMALLRNLRNMDEASVHDGLIREALVNMKPDRVLPFRFIAAARVAPKFEPELEVAMLNCLSARPKLSGHTVLLVDVSGSMREKLSGKSDLLRTDAACGLAMLLREVCEQVDIFTFSMKLVRVPARRGFALRDAINSSQTPHGTPLGLAVASIYADRDCRVGQVNFGYSGAYPVDYSGQALRPDRLIVITDEQSADPVPDPTGRGYMLNVASSKNGVGYGPWTHVDGFSEAVVDYVSMSEAAELT